MKGNEKNVIVVDSNNGSLMIDAATCGGDQIVQLTLDELHRAYMYGYSNCIDANPLAPAPVRVEACILTEKEDDDVQ